MTALTIPPSESLVDVLRYQLMEEVDSDESMLGHIPDYEAPLASIRKTRLAVENLSPDNVSFSVDGNLIQALGANTLAGSRMSVQYKTGDVDGIIFVDTSLILSCLDTPSQSNG